MTDDPDRHNDEPQRHECVLPPCSPGLDGRAIERVYEDDQGRFIAENGEYGSEVHFCPVCGAKAPTPPRVHVWKPTTKGTG